ncbi:DUF6152 family protein [Steroidobacter sp.]|uniref:DUF6152 family protein n=1 Tax=Steroidobacter sp. TaxID=1978227 RepID=UPI001A3E580C|nr:DUF6152 family protein [Steroidobacter sp.]MBL8269536.1 hypothetical protein [Steroidobacter sp.]
MRTPVKLSLLALLSGMLTVQADAHHSYAMFDEDKCATIAGNVRKFTWAYPHMWLWVETGTGADAKPILWGFEGGDPASLAVAGWKPDTLKRGDKVTVLFNPLRDGRKGGSLRQVTFENGKTLGAQVSGSVDDKYFSTCKPAKGS